MNTVKININEEDDCRGGYLLNELYIRTINDLFTAKKLFKDESDIEGAQIGWLYWFVNKSNNRKIYLTAYDIDGHLYGAVEYTVSEWHKACSVISKYLNNIISDSEDEKLNSIYKSGKWIINDKSKEVVYIPTFNTFISSVLSNISK